MATSLYEYYVGNFSLSQVYLIYTPFQEYNDNQLLEDGSRVNFRNVVYIKYTSDINQCLT